MKTTMKILALSGILLFAQACSKDDENQIDIQEHDQNQMMAIMHNMMDGMMEMQKTNDPDNDFAMMMRMHHQGAIEMSELELQNGKDPEMRELAQMIMAAQEAEIQELTAFLQSHPAHANIPEFSMKQMMNMERSGRNADLQIINGNTDHDFATLMIGHHESAIENSRLEMIYGHEPAMKAMAAKIIEAQEMEIKELQEWLLVNRNK